MCALMRTLQYRLQLVLLHLQHPHFCYVFSFSSFFHCSRQGVQACLTGDKTLAFFALSMDTKQVASYSKRLKEGGVSVAGKHVLAPVSSRGDVPFFWKMGRCRGVCSKKSQFFCWVIVMSSVMLLFEWTQIEAPFEPPNWTNVDYMHVLPALAKAKGGFLLRYDGVEEGGGKKEDTHEADVVLSLQMGKYHLRQNVCLFENGNGLGIRRAGAGEKVKRDGSVFLVHGCGISAQSREMISLFLWMQQYEAREGKNSSVDSLPHSFKVGGEVFFPPQIKLLIVALGGGGHCKRGNRAQYGCSRMIHWIRVATDRFRLWPLCDGGKATRYLIVNLTRGAKHEVIPLSSFSMNDTSCVEYLLSTKGNSSQWFPSSFWAHRFRLHWVRYLSEQRTAEYVDAMGWGTQPISPVLHNTVSAAVAMGNFGWSTTAPAVVSSERNSSAVTGMFSLTSVRSRLLITLLSSSENPSNGLMKIALFLHQKFGKVGQVQLLYHPSMKREEEENADKNEDGEDKKTVPGGKGGGNNAEAGVVVRTARNYCHFLCILMLTDVLIAPHGSALVGLVVMLPKSAVIELFPRRCHPPMYLQLATAMRISYFTYEGMDENGGVNEKRQKKENALQRHQEASARMRNISTPAAGFPLRLPRVEDVCYQRSWIHISDIRLYHLVRNGMSSVWLRESRFFGVQKMDRR